MELILWRHADAEDGKPDLERKLTPKGEKQAKRAAKCSSSQASGPEWLSSSSKCSLPAGVRPLAPLQGSDPSSQRLQLQRCAESRGLAPLRPTALASQRPFRSRVGLGEEEQGARAAPDDLLTSYPGLGARAPCSVASAPARALVWSAHRPWPSADFGFAASGPRAGAWMVCPPTS